ncbi:MAG: acyl-[acyl-carrier-protein]--UDP-N-acetylglucosamine O-acyltransferase [Actinomycetales bacterium]|nr:MAG: acyl-[acyl-carrier-protein]--UDP-N-acetylglucosamine O-acyltransferase [Actinomycetales bacterium]|tara:strand:- start:702 stop:1487 length:786 start_codon:yes stop_codon:yes gene_type:complete
MIHPSSIISESAKIDKSSYIGPFCVIGDNVEIGKNNRLISHVSILGYTNIKNNNIFYPYSSIGSDPQDLKYKDEKSFLEIGSNNKFRENVTVNPGTSGGGLKTIIKDNCLFMVGSHIAHDCKISSNVILANNATLAGHVEIHENAIIGGNSAIHQFVRIGKFAMIGGMSGVEKDIIPYGLYTGIRENLKSLNIVGLKRKGLKTDLINKIKTLVNLIFDQKDTIVNNIKKNSIKDHKISEIKEIISFINTNTKRGITSFNND